ncbi:MAG: 4Fe-4S dicluster domain-containing protein [Desulfobacterales bacterium]|nr:4Fe-4S dicluster domain-containing protein [Desulfobacterales bacterium]
MFYQSTLYISLIIFVAGLIYQVSFWFRRHLGITGAGVPASKRVMAALQGCLGVIGSRNILTLFKVLFLDVILQIRTLREDFYRWLMHILIYWGFMLLLFMHALDKIIMAKIFSNYYATLNPFMFLRNYFGVMVIVGIGLAVLRRCFFKIPRLRTHSMDYFIMVIIGLIIGSGYLLEAVKITSHTRFGNHVFDYLKSEDEKEIKALESLWVKEYGLVSPNLEEPLSPELLSMGRELNESCVSCHSRPRWAFVSYGLAKMIRSRLLGVGLDRAGLPDILWHVHFLACFLGLIYLPFSKMFHLIAGPVSLLANSVMNRDTSDPANIATRQIMELDACTHCGTCTLRCSVAIAFEKIGNVNILPSEKMVYLKNFVAHKNISEKELKIIQEGIYLCTNCDRCTVSCPVGINLRELWFGVREELIQKGGAVPLTLSPFSFYRGLNKQYVDAENYARPLDDAQKAIADGCALVHHRQEVASLSPVNEAFKSQLTFSKQSGTTNAYCFSCENCTTVCPVVENYENPQEKLDLLPHQIMRAVELGLKDLALGSRMLWDCVTCYQCQEHCPQGVKVTDVLYELKNAAVKEMQS